MERGTAEEHLQASDPLMAELIARVGEVERPRPYRSVASLYLWQAIDEGLVRQTR